MLMLTVDAVATIDTSDDTIVTTIDAIATIDTIVIIELHSGGSVCVHPVSPLYQGPQP